MSRNVNRQTEEGEIIRSRADNVSRRARAAIWMGVEGGNEGGKRTDREKERKGEKTDLYLKLD